MINPKITILISSFLVPFLAYSEQISIGGKEYECQRIIERKIAPGTTYLRLRLPDYPLNVNMVMVDLNNKYNRIETTVANESAKGTESLVKAASRLTTPAHRPVAAANANFWIVGGQNEYPLYSGITRNASVRNGKMVTESNQFQEKWDKGTSRTGVVSISYDKVLNIDYCTSSITFTKKGGKAVEIHQCNKGFRSGEYCMYNSFYGADREFMPVKVVDKIYTLDEANDATEVLLDIKPGQEWTGGKDILFEVKEVRKNAGHGTLGNHDLAIVGRETGSTANLDLAPGDEIALKYRWTYTGLLMPVVEQAIGGNALVMRHGVLTEHNYNEDYNSTIYSRTGYGCSKDGKTLYMIVIDKSTDPVYGKSAGCSTAAMSEIALHFGCWNLSNFDAGGSAELMIDTEIINKTTEATPRNVANGWMVFSTAPEDNTITSIEFDHPQISLETGESFTPTILAYNQYEDLVNKNLTGFTLSCSPEIGSCSGNVFVASSQPAYGTLTATYGNISVSKNVSVGGAVSSVREIVGDIDIIFSSKIAKRGETFNVKSNNFNIKHVDLLNQNGISVISIPCDDTSVSLKTPEQTGIYIARVVLSNGFSKISKIIIN